MQEYQHARLGTKTGIDMPWAEGILQGPREQRSPSMQTCHVADALCVNALRYRLKLVKRKRCVPQPTSQQTWHTRCLARSSTPPGMRCACVC
jgi:hypothetical protein